MIYRLTVENDRLTLETGDGRHVEAETMIEAIETFGRWWVSRFPTGQVPELVLEECCLVDTEDILQRPSKVAQEPMASTCERSPTYGLLTSKSGCERELGCGNQDCGQCYRDSEIG